MKLLKIKSAYIEGTNSIYINPLLIESITNYSMPKGNVTTIYMNSKEKYLCEESIETILENLDKLNKII